MPCSHPIATVATSAPERREDLMKFVTAVVCAGVLLSSRTVRAESFPLAGAFSTDGVFTCVRSLPCTGSGTSSVTLGSGSNTATLTFNGVDTTIDIDNVARPVTLGHFEVTGSPGFTFPKRINPTNPVLRFNFRIRQTSPVDNTNSKELSFGPGGKSDLPLLMGTDHTSFGLATSAPGFRYEALVYSIAPFPFKISGNGVTDFTARVGVVPEPATFVLVGGGLAAAIAARRRKRALA
jgi:hypothetical protein